MTKNDKTPVFLAYNSLGMLAVGYPDGHTTREQCIQELKIALAGQETAIVVEVEGRVLEYARNDTDIDAWANAEGSE